MQRKFPHLAHTGSNKQFLIKDEFFFFFVEFLRKCEKNPISYLLCFIFISTEGENKLMEAVVYLFYVFINFCVMKSVSC